MQSRARLVRRRQVLGGAAALLAGGLGPFLAAPGVQATPPPPISFTKSSYSTGNQPYSMARGDLNGNGYADLVIANSGDGTLTVLLNNGNGTLSAATNSPIIVPGGVFHVLIGDFFNTGKPAIFASGLGGYFTLFPNLTAPGNTTITLGPRVTTPSGAASAIAAGDIDGDGTIDIVYAAVATSPMNTGTINVLLGKGDGTFRVGPSWATPTVIYALNLYDLNGDGFPEIVGSRALSNNQVFVWDQTPSGRWAAAAGSPYTTDPYSGPANITTLVPGQPPVIAVPCAGNNTIDLFQCGGPYANPFLTPWPGSPLSTTAIYPNAALFLDLDGRRDLCVLSMSTNILEVHTSDGHGGFNPPLLFTDPSMVGPVAIAGLNLDNSGKSSLAVMNYDSKSVTLFQNATAYTPTLRIDDYTPSGPLKGGNVIEIHGAGFDSTCDVFIGGIKAKVIVVSDAGTILVVAPDASSQKISELKGVIRVESLYYGNAYGAGFYQWNDQPTSPVDPNGPPSTLPSVKPIGPPIPGNPPSPLPRQGQPQGGTGGVPVPAPTHR